MNPNHFVQSVSSPEHLAVSGDYFALEVRHIALRAEVLTDRILAQVARLTLIQIVVSNSQDFRMPADYSDTIIVDSDGFQHAVHYLSDSATILRAGRLASGTPIAPPAWVVEGHARTKGWLAFPPLEEDLLPHRLIYQHNVFSPGAIDGHVQATETLELVFDLSIFARLLGDATSTV
jgi:hypothetical protein